jgi:hypothetical protein
MDPKVCWLTLCDALRHGDMQEAAEAAMALREWQLKGGFMPAEVPEGIGGRLRDFAKVCSAVAALSKE